MMFTYFLQENPTEHFFVIQPLVIVFSCVSVYVWRRERGNEVELSFQDIHDLYFLFKEESFLCSEENEHLSSALF